MQTIEIKKSPTADTRTCEFGKVSIYQLLDSTKSHIADVQAAMALFAAMLQEAAKIHDCTKLTHLPEFFNDFRTGFERQEWYQLHKSEERHHLNSPDGIREDVNLLDVIEFIADCVMGGMARSGTVYPSELSNELLQKALLNTINLLIKHVKVVAASREC